MKKIMSFAAAFCAAAMLTGCAGLYANYTNPVAVSGNNVGKKVGTSSNSNILGIIWTGDGGIDGAAKDGGIKKISHVDQQVTSVLGLFTTYKTIVYGD